MDKLVNIENSRIFFKSKLLIELIKIYLNANVVFKRLNSMRVNIFQTSK